MGIQKLKWSVEEEAALQAGVAKHGAGKWKNILKDPEVAPVLINRSNIDLKDKWRNVKVSMALAAKESGSKERPWASKVRPNTAAARVSSFGALVSQNAIPDDVIDNASNSAPEHKSKITPRSRLCSTEIVLEALSTLSDVNGSEIGAILSFIKRKHGMPVPTNFKRTLCSKLKRLVFDGKLEMVQNCYKIKKAETLGTKTSTQTLTPVEKDVTQWNLQKSGSMTFTEMVQTVQDAVQDAADAAATAIAKAEVKFFLAAEQLARAKLLSKFEEDTESMLQLSNEIYEQCSRGEVVALG